MRKVVIAALFLALVASPSVFVFAAGNAVAGKDVFVKHCAACHAQDGNGNQAVASMMKVTIPQLPSKDVQALSDDQISKVITTGKDKMKPVTGLSPADIANVTAFIRTLAKK